MIEFNSALDIPEDFTGVCKILWNNSIRSIKNGKLHREDGPACEFASGEKSWYYKNKKYGAKDDFTNETWIKKVKEIKYLESLEIFK